MVHAMMELGDGTWIFVVTVSGCLGIRYVAHRWSFSGVHVSRFDARRSLLSIVALGVALALTSQLYASRERWALVTFCLALFAALQVREIVRWRRFFRSLDEICLDADDARAETFLALRRPPVGRAARARWFWCVLHAASRAHELDRTDRGLRWLDALDAGSLPPDRRLVLRLSRASLALSLGRKEIARAELNEIPANVASSEMAEAIAWSRLLLSVLDGTPPSTALDDVRARRAREKTPQSVWIAIEAHLLAARGDESAARATLRELRMHYGDIAIKRVARHGGPASPLALRLDEDEPYR